ncbi:MAG: FAD:protein FMN transferase [Kiritimatiellales bacterium]|nr:FAD:protein FMN transferase [Kiritimatiellales bacterium]
MTRKKIIQIIFGFALVAAFGIRSLYIRHPIITGWTMGTSYSVTVKGFVSRHALTDLAKQIEAELVEVNRQMSTWIPESEISRFNSTESTEAFPTSEGFASVVKESLELSQTTSGAFDPTLQPLLKVWGFGSEGEEHKVPTDAVIAQAKSMIGWRHLTSDGTSSIRKDMPALALDLGAIAKGYGVDAIGQLLERNGYDNWFVEIGGEVVVRGTNPKGNPWRIGIQYPTTNPMDDRLQGVVNLSAGAVATSGDYRNYIEQDGVIYSHILDPRSGRAVLSDAASVTVTAPDCTLADGVATALFVMGPDEGLAWVEQRPEIEAMFLVRGENGKILEKFSSGFRTTTSYIPSN